MLAMASMIHGGKFLHSKAKATTPQNSLHFLLSLPCLLSSPFLLSLPILALLNLN